MDWYKLFELVTPSILTGGTIVIGAYLGYFKKKFATYGDIEAKLQKLPELEDISRAQATGQHSAEFEYYKMKNDFDKLSEFTRQVGEYTFKIDDLIHQRIKKREEIVNRWSENHFNNDDLTPIDSSPMQEITQWIRETKLIYILHLKKYRHDKFDREYQLWTEGNLTRIESDTLYSLRFNVIVDSKIPDNEKIDKFLNHWKESTSDISKFNNDCIIKLNCLMNEIEDLAKKITSNHTNE